MARRKCPRCNAEVPAEIAFCVRCGHPFRSTRRNTKREPLRILAFLVIFALIVVIVVQTIRR